MFFTQKIGKLTLLNFSVQPMINLPLTPSEKPTKTKSILKPAQFQDHDFSKHNRRVRLFLESEQTLL